LPDQSLFDPGAYLEPPLNGMITGSVTQPWTAPANEKEVKANRNIAALKEFLRNRGKKIE
jgi:hypothetical protein